MPMETKTATRDAEVIPAPTATLERQLGIPSQLEQQAETELARREKESLLFWLTKLDEGVKRFDQFITIAENARKVAIRRTNPEDWGISACRDRVATGMLC